MISITKEAPADLGALTDLEAVLAWRSKPGAGQKQRRGFAARLARAGRRRSTTGVDLDAAALALNASGRVIAACSVDDMRPLRGSLEHGGDDTGQSTDSAETIKLHLSRLPDQVEAVALLLTSFEGQGFDQVNEASLALMSGATEEGTYYLPISGPRANAALMVVIRRKPADRSAWEIQALEQLINIPAFEGGNNDGQVDWRDLDSRYTELLRVRR